VSVENDGFTVVGGDSGCERRDDVVRFDSRLADGGNEDLREGLTIAIEPGAKLLGHRLAPGLVFRIEPMPPRGLLSIEDDHGVRRRQLHQRAAEGLHGRAEGRGEMSRGLGSRGVNAADEVQPSTMRKTTFGSLFRPRRRADARGRSDSMRRRHE
jgi:hypothetical protein